VSCRKILTEKYPNSNIPKTNRQDKRKLIEDCVSFFKSANTSEQFKFVVSNLAVLPGLQVDSVALGNFTSSTIVAIKSTITAKTTNKIKNTSTGSPKNETYCEKAKNMGKSNTKEFTQVISDRQRRKSRGGGGGVFTDPSDP